MSAGSFLVLIHAFVIYGAEKISTSQKNSVSNGSLIVQRKPNVNACVSRSGQLLPWLYSGLERAAKRKGDRLAAELTSPMSLESVVGIMKQFVADIGGASTHPLPKMRKTVHDLAHASNLSNKRKRSGASRFTTLRTTLSGVNVDKKAIAQILGQTSSYVTHEGGKDEGSRPRA